MRLALFAPEWDRPCSACRAWVYNDNGTLARTAAGDPIKRPAGVPTPCLKCPKPPQWAKDAGKGWEELQPLAGEMSDANRAAYRFYRECRAVLAFPDDAVVRWYAAIIRDVEDERDRLAAAKQEGGATHLTKLLEFYLRTRR